MADSLTSPSSSEAQLVAEDALFRQLRRPWATLGLLGSQMAIYVVVGAIPYARGNADVVDIVIRTRGPRLLARCGGMWADGVDAGQLWRLISAAWLHGGWLHMVLNALALVAVGRVAEAVYGRIRMVWMFVFSATVGAMASWVSGTTLSVGASGGILGLFAALVIFGWRHPAALPAPSTRFFRWSLLPWLIVNVAVGFVPPLDTIIDNAAHIGGLVAGGCVASVLGNRLMVSPSRSLVDWRGLVMAGATLVLLMWAARGVSTLW